MKTLFALCAALGISFTLLGCGGGGDTTADTPVTPAEETTPDLGPEGDMGSEGDLGATPDSGSTL